MSWMIPDNMLDDDQRQVKNFIIRDSRSSLIQGPAGSGKTVMLVKIVQDTFAKSFDAKVCMVLFTRSLIDMMKTGIPEQISSKVKMFTAYEFQKSQQRTDWDLIIIDEVQDIKDQLLNQVFNSAKQVVVAGDAGQSIYDDCVSMKDYFENVQNVTKQQLKKIYRLPKSVQRIAYYFADDAETFINYRVHQNVANVSVELKKYFDQQQETREVWKKAREFAWQSLSCVVIFPVNNDIVTFCNEVLSLENKESWDVEYDYGRSISYESLNFHLKKNDIQLQVIGKGAGSMSTSNANNLVNVMTYHSVKGLDFEAVFVPKLNRSTLIWSKPDIARRMFFVAITRSRRNLFLSYYGNPHEFVERIPKNLVTFTEVKDGEEPELTVGTDYIDF